MYIPPLPPTLYVHEKLIRLKYTMNEVKSHIWMHQYEKEVFMFPKNGIVVYWV